jgi:sn1-specific diacylglycerol lipase
MPHLKVANRLLRISGDDILIPILFATVGRIMWFAVLIVILYLDFIPMIVCTNGILLMIYLILSILNLFAGIVLDSLIMYTSTRGTMVEKQERRVMGKYVAARGILSLIQLLVVIVGIVGLSIDSRIPCNAKLAKSNVDKFIFSVIITSQCLDICFLLSCSLLVVGKDRDQLAEDGQDEESELEKIQNRCRKWYQWLEKYGFNNFRSGNSNESIEEVARVVANYFRNYGFVDVVPSDILAGIILLRTEQRSLRKKSWYEALVRAKEEEAKIKENQGEEAKYEMKKRVVTLPKGELRTCEVYDDRAPSESINFVNVIARCSIYAAVIYNRIIPLDDSNWNVICNLCHCRRSLQQTSTHQTSRIRLCCCCWVGSVVHEQRQHQEENQPGFSSLDVHGLNFLGLNRIGVSAFSEHLGKAELIFISFRNDTIHKPFAIFVDHQEELIVITIRGTLSIEDCITDVTCDPVEVGIIT